MTTSEILLQDYDAEIASTRRLLERIPATPDFKPHDKSMPLGKLAMHVAYLPMFGSYILTEPGMDVASSHLLHPDLTWKDSETLLAALETSAATCRAALTAASDEDLAKKWKFTYGEYLISENPRSLSYRTLFFNHMIHHRAQLSVYLRLNEVPVPGLYGPSADEPFGS